MKKPPARGATFAAPSDVLAGRGREALGRGRFKEAMEVFKQLARQDPQPEWTHRLADAYIGRAHALAEKGMFKEAAMVLENTLSPDAGTGIDACAVRGSGTRAGLAAAVAA